MSQHEGNKKRFRIATVFLFCAFATASVFFVLDKVGPFALNIFGRGLIVSSIGAPAVAICVFCAATYFLPQVFRSRMLLAAALVLFVANIAFNEVSLRNVSLPACDAKLVNPSDGAYKDFNIIVISLDTLRADHIGAFGYGRNTMPNAGAFASESILFENALAQAPATLASHATAFTGLYPGAHRAQLRTYEPLPDSALTLAEILKSNGYTTASFNGGAQLSSNFGMNQGFDVYEDDEMYISDIWPIAKKWLGKNSNKKFLLFLHCYDIHTPYDPPAPYDKMYFKNYKGSLPGSISLEIADKINSGKTKITPSDAEHIRAAYDGGIRYTDSKLGEIISFLKSKKLLSNSIVVLMSDHGEELGEHGTYALHHHALYEMILHVPLLMRLPGRPPRHIAERVKLVDLTPTLLDLLGVPYKPASFQGESLATLTSGRAQSRDDSKTCAFSEKERNPLTKYEYLKSMIAGDWKLVARTPNPAQSVVMKFFGSIIYPMRDKLLFNLRSDPAEKRNLAASDLQRVRAMDKLILKAVRWNEEYALKEADVNSIDGNFREF